MGEAGVALHSGAPDGRLDVRSLCLIRETLARHDGLADFALPCRGWGRGAISLFGSPEQRAHWLPLARGGKAISARADRAAIGLGCGEFHHDGGPGR